MSENENVVNSTIDNYSGRAQSFSNWAYSTEANKAALATNKFLAKLSELTSDSLSVVDLGCGPGRDLEVFKNSKSPRCTAIGVDACPELCEIARSKTGCEVMCAEFRDLEKFFKPNSIHGIFSLASLFHIPRSELSELIEIMIRVLAPGGILLSSFPCGRDQDGNMSDGRWSNSMPLELHQQILESHGLEVIDVFHSKIYNGDWGVVISKKN